MNALDVLDKEVIAQDGTKVGKIKDLIFDHASWTVSALVVELEKNIAQEFNVKKALSKTRIRISVHHIQGMSDRIVLRVPREELFRVPTEATSAPQAQ
ncbi:MAG: PRC-barrel domain-containing protein [archaeon]|nr:PRC-barrel domain-containing protein [archaeon]